MFGSRMRRDFFISYVIVFSAIGIGLVVIGFCSYYLTIGVY